MSRTVSRSARLRRRQREWKADTEECLRRMQQRPGAVIVDRDPGDEDKPYEQLADGGTHAVEATQRELARAKLDLKLMHQRKCQLEAEVADLAGVVSDLRRRLLDKGAAAATLANPLGADHENRP